MQIKLYMVSLLCVCVCVHHRKSIDNSFYQLFCLKLIIALYCSLRKPIITFDPILLGIGCNTLVQACVRAVCVCGHLGNRVIFFCTHCILCGIRNTEHFLPAHNQIERHTKISTTTTIFYRF